MGRGGSLVLCAKIISLHALSFLDSEPKAGLVSREGLSTSGQGSLPPHPAHARAVRSYPCGSDYYSVVGCVP